MVEINYHEVKEELERKNLYDIQRELTMQRRTRTAMMSLLIFSLLFTIVFGMLEDPFLYTLSNIGNFFSYRFLFIIWSIVSGVTIQLTVIALFRLEDYQSKFAYYSIGLASFFLIATGLIPALREDYPFWHFMHTVTSGLHALFLYLGLVPFSRWISKENPRLRISIYIWQIVIWIGSILLVIFFRKSALFELWFFVTNIVFLLYLSLVLFEEKIIKISVQLLLDEDNLNLAIEKIFVNLDVKTIDKNRPSPDA